MDFTLSDNWALHPHSLTKDVDCFMLYPTIYGGRYGMNMPENDESLRSRAVMSLQEMKGVFEDSCHIFAPFYRQMAMAGLYLPVKEQEEHLSIALEDVINAFLHYLRNDNQGRPFILAGHSQGAHLLLLLMKALFNDPVLQSLLVAAYIIGYAVTKEDLAECPWLKVASSADDLGRIITYNSQSATAVGSPIHKPGSCCVNPLIWNQSGEYAPRWKNKGSVFVTENGCAGDSIPGFTDAWINEHGALIVDPVDTTELDVGLFPAGVYHRYDYAFFYLNLKENVANRIQAFLTKRNQYS